MHRDDQPEVSVVIPVYNASAYLAEAVESVLRQTFTDWELVAVDDGSSDNSLEILRGFESQDSRIKVLPLTHRGIAGTRNAGIHAAQGEYLAALDNDDIMCPRRLEVQVDFMRKHPDFVAVGAAGLLVDADGDPIAERSFPSSSEEVESELLKGRNPLMQSGMMFRREAMLRVGAYQDDRNFAEDYDLFLRLTEIGRIGNLNEVLMRQRQHISRASAAHYADQNRVVMLALRDAYARRGLTQSLPTIEGSWHPTTARDYHIRCASDAWDAGNITTVRKHAGALVREQAFSPRGWELYARTIMGRNLYRGVAQFKSFFRPLKKLCR
ncbi:putative glycosyltransferase EpsE [Novipirellula galeiformis]|uniref:Putative glycosyltransferase EpsE n=1 Tax=Novipirellula galeiformis TaxID=2528004 RepID=A0A5C6C9C9_9BACT|nr:glycosyltransferase family A protein [Novipirellula galeiformis]TWU20715.1 putative glycosyltransferase EpsE [Novipirellula galeiformis]